MTFAFICGTIGALIVFVVCWFFGVSDGQTDALMVLGGGAFGLLSGILRHAS